MTVEEQLQYQTNINLQLRRQLETCRRDVVGVCAKFCEDHEVFKEMGLWHLENVEGTPNNDVGMTYAAGLRHLIGRRQNG